MYSLLVAADHLLVVVVDVLRGWTGTPAGRHDVPAVLSGGPGKPVAWVSPAAHHQVRVARMSPAVPELRVPGHTPGPVQSLVEVALHHPLGVHVHHIVVARGDGLQSVTGRVQRPAGHSTLVTYFYNLYN